jgi:hypothetical protein
MCLLVTDHQSWRLAIDQYLREAGGYWALGLATVPLYPVVNQDLYTILKGRRKERRGQLINER